MIDLIASQITLAIPSYICLFVAPYERARSVRSIILKLNKKNKIMLNVNICLI